MNRSSTLTSKQKVTLMSCAPFVSSPHDVVKKMLEVARASKDDVLCDLGCGDGRILTTAVKDFGIKAAVGYEIRCISSTSTCSKRT